MHPDAVEQGEPGRQRAQPDELSVRLRLPDPGGQDARLGEAGEQPECGHFGDIDSVRMRVSDILNV